MAAERISPYTPSFGMVPHILAGRTDLLDEHVAGLRSGPGNVRFTHALTGDRGVGKTAFLTVLGQRMSGEGWAVLAYQARRERDAVRELLEELPYARDTPGTGTAGDVDDVEAVKQLIDPTRRRRPRQR